MIYSSHINSQVYPYKGISEALSQAWLRPAFPIVYSQEYWSFEILYGGKKVPIDKFVSETL